MYQTNQYEGMIAETISIRVVGRLLTRAAREPVGAF